MINNKLKVFIGSSICVLSLGCGYILSKSICESIMTSDVEHYYIKNEHDVSSTYHLKTTAWDDGVLDINDISNDYIIPEGYAITKIEETSNPNYANITYVNIEDVIDIKNGSPFGLPISNFSDEYVEIAKKKHSK